MSLRGAGREVVIGLSPLGQPSARAVAEIGRAGGLGVLDLGAGDVRVREALDLAQKWSPGPFGVRVPEGCRLAPSDLPSGVDTVVLGANSPWRPAELAGYRVLVEVTSRAEAARASSEGAHGLIARGHEAGGRVGELSSFVLLQQLTADSELPVWVCGGIGPHTAAAAVLGGATGVVLDTQLALFPEAELSEEIVDAISGSDGSNTVLAGGRRVLQRRTSTGTDLPVGQDVFLAKRFAGHFGKIGHAVRGVTEAVLSALDAEPDVLRPGSPLAKALGTEFPIAQGPMTRVSDQAEFAAAVATAGALPFIALALANEAQTRTMLEETRRAIPDRPWGAGVLGFAPEEVRSAQLDVIRELRPSCVIVAGGRPAQAAALEAEGIAAFLHVPSPGLLRQFLDAGARKFIFEGSECGGHVGPRASFPLWEAQIGVLEDYLSEHPEHAGEIQVFFAGGVHDAKSAAMVTAAAGPLAALGVGVGVLMGSAYLFTEEAVAHRAVLPTFQQQVIAAERTALLETAPGHVTRCVVSPFTERFGALRADLRSRGMPDREVWEALEQVNVGRLRIASKGLRRQDAELVTVDEPGQLAEGLFMAGQVAVLRSEVTTIAELHRSVSASAEFLTGRAELLRERFGPAMRHEAPKPLDVAIVGMACMFPAAPDLATFWANVVGGVDAVTEVPARRWDADVYYAKDGNGERTPSKWGGFLPEIPFDPLRYGIPPSSLAAIEPVQLLALAVADRALADAGYADGGFDRDRTSVVFGAEAGSDLANAIALRNLLPSYVDRIPAQLDEQLPKLTEDTFPGTLANVIAGRIANRLDLGGANYTVDAACASSLAAIDVACKELVNGTSDVALAGGADLHNGINDYLMFSSVHALSPTGRCRTFDGSADGIALGEGVACVVLKRLADAERDGDRVYAVIKGVGSASDGKSLGLTAPRPEGQRRALERAYLNAGVSPAEVGLVEAHGTGTVVGDRTELTTLSNVFTEFGAALDSCAIGSVKSQIGHTKCAAGLAGLIKAAMALHTGTKPPTLHVSDPNPGWRRDGSPFSFFPEARPWAARPEDRIAGVSAFGFGGTNFHVVLKAHDAGPAPRHGLDEWPAELFTFRGARDVEWLLDLVGKGEWRLRDLAKTTALRTERRAEPVRIAVVATSVENLSDLLRRALAGEHDPARGVFQTSAHDGKLAVLFPGQGSQRPGMLADLFVTFPETQHFLQLGRKWADTMFPAAAFGDDAQQELRIRDTRVAQPTLGMAGLAVHHLLTRLDVKADMYGGHSYGELVALAASGAFDASVLLELSAARADAILSSAGADPGTMAAVAASAAEVREVLRTVSDEVVVANDNAPRQAVISGPTPLVDRALEALRAAGLAATRIPVACAFHSPRLAAAGEKFGEALASHRIRAPESPVWSNRTASAYPASADAVRAELSAQIASPVGFVAQIEAMYEAGARVFLEAGPGRVLSRLVDDILGDRPHVTVACEGKAGKGVRGFLAAIAALAVAGVPLRTGWLFSGRDTCEVSGAAPARKPGWTIDGQTVRTAGGEYLAGGLAPARRIQEIIAQPQGTNRETLISAFLQTSREAVAAQRDVLLSYLGTVPAAPVYQPAPLQPLAQLPAPAVVTPELEPAPEESTLDVLGTVLSVIGDRTGYPVDMIEPDLDLEADLSVDSIKRTEIAGELLTRFKLPAAEVDSLSKLRTTSSIAAWFEGHLGATETPEAASTGSDSAGPGTRKVALRGVAPQRFEVQRVRVENGADGSVEGKTVAVVGGPQDVAEEVRRELTAKGAIVGTREGAVDGVVHLGALETAPTEADESSVPDLVPLFQQVLATGPRWLIAAAHGMRFPGLRGLFRSIAREYPDTMARVVEVEPERSPAELARLVVAELLVTDSTPVVLTGNGTRQTLEMTKTSLGALGSTGAGPAGDGAAEAAALGLDRDSVVLLAGGARGITAQFAETLAAASGCRIELLGRTPLPAEPEHPKTAAANDLPGLRAALVELGAGTPAEIDRAANRILAMREVAATLEEIGRHAASVRYHSADVRDQEAMQGVIKQIYAEHGRLDGLVCAAGIIEDRLFADKDAESFRRVFDTKVDGTRALLSALVDAPEPPGFVVLFGSIAAVLGNRGQTDYAAANDALESIGAAWAQRTGARALTVHWGPWAPGARHGGMVSPELGRSYASRGIELIDPEEGTLSLLRELAWGDPALRSVVYTASGW